MAEPLAATPVAVAEITPLTPTPDVNAGAIDPVTSTGESPFIPPIVQVVVELVGPQAPTDARPALEYATHLDAKSTATAAVLFGESTATAQEVKVNETPQTPDITAAQDRETVTVVAPETPTTATDSTANTTVEGVVDGQTTTAAPEEVVTVEQQVDVQPQPEESRLKALRRKPESPPAEATKTSGETALTREQMKQTLQEASQLLLELKDFRIYLTSLAQHVGDTSLGGEFRHNVLSMIKNLPMGDVPKEMAARLKALQEKIPAAYASKRSTELLSFLTTNKDDFPNLITDKLMVAVADGKVNDEQVVLSLTGDKTTVLGDRMREAMGINETQLQTAMNNLAEATKDPDWKDKWAAFMLKHPKLKPHIPSWAELRANAPSYFYMFAMGLIAFNSLATQDEGGGRQGH